MPQSNDWNKYCELLKFFDECLFGLGLHLTLILISFTNLTHDAFCWRYFSKKVLDREDTRGSKKPLYKKLAVIMERNTGVISERNIAVILEGNSVVIWDRNTVSNLESTNYGNSEENTAT